MQTLPIEGDLRERVLAALGQTPLLKALKRDQLEYVLQAASLHEYEAGESVTRQGEPSDSFFLLLSGTLSVSVDGEGGKRVEIGHIHPPESLGEIGLLLGQPRTATVVAAERSLVVRFETKAFTLLFEKVPAFGIAVSQGLAHRLQLLSYRVPVAPYSKSDLPDAATLGMLPVAFLERHRVLPLKAAGNVLTLGFVDEPTSAVLGGAQQLLPGMELTPIRIEAELYNEAMRTHVGLEGWVMGTGEAEGQAVEEGPPRSAQLDRLLARMATEGSSDFHLTAGQKPRWRVDGQILELADAPVPGKKDVEDMLWPLLNEGQREEFREQHDCDFAYTSPGLARARINLYVDHRGTCAAIRLISARVMSFEQLGLHDSIRKLCEEPNGLVLVTGPTGSGKSSTLAACVDHINRTRADHIITLEDPIEFLHPSQKSLVQQREVGAHTSAFSRGLRAALREDPNVLLVGEMRDLPTVSLAMEAANTGMLVLATLHTNSAVATVDRIVDLYPAEQQPQARSSLAEVLRGVVSQTLLPKIGGGRVAAVEVLVVNTAVSNLIKEAKTNQIPNVMQTTRQEGQFILNEELARLVRRRTVTYEDALSRSPDKKDLDRRLGKAEPPKPPGAPGTPPPAGQAPPKPN